MSATRNAADWLESIQEELARGCFVARVTDPMARGPSPVLIRADGVYDLNRTFPMMRAITEHGDIPRRIDGAPHLPGTANHRSNI